MTHGCLQHILCHIIGNEYEIHFNSHTELKIIRADSIS